MYKLNQPHEDYNDKNNKVRDLEEELEHAKLTHDI